MRSTYLMWFLAAFLSVGIALANQSAPQRNFISIGISLKKVSGEAFTAPVTVNLVQTFEGDFVIYGKAEKGLAWIQQVPWGLWTITVPGWETNPATIQVAPGKVTRVAVTMVGKSSNNPKGTTVIIRVPGGTEGQMVSLVEKTGKTYGRRFSTNITGSRVTIPWVPKGTWIVAFGDGHMVPGHVTDSIKVTGQRQVTCTVRVRRKPSEAGRR